jgi:hypothetical protein
MADEKPDLKSLEMRIAAIEDKLSKLNISEEDLKTYQRVSAALGGGTEAAAAGPAIPAPDACQVCQITRQRLVCINRGIIPRQIVRFCVECNECGPCACGQAGGGFSGGGGFGGFGF